VKFPVSALKIDKSFIMGMSSNPSAIAVAKAIIVMGHEIGATVIAEGLESLEHVEQVAQFGCDYGQGYYFSRPVSAEETASFLQQKKSFF
jgi:EAL domain-containing protein (putative c-di-GMP-specific phosphodiesterase class I)